MAVTQSFAACNAGMDAKAALLNNGYLRFYDGTKPANPNVAVTTQVLLAVGRFGIPAFQASVNGVATANAISPAIWVADGTATWARAFQSDNTTAMFDFSVGTSGTDIVLTSATIDDTHAFAITAATLTDPRT